jgi:hypothetical protein
MAGFDRDRAFAELAVPTDYNIEAVFAIGRRGDPFSLPEELRTRETPSDRLPLRKLAFEGSFREE